MILLVRHNYQYSPRQNLNNQWSSHKIFASSTIRITDNLSPLQIGGLKSMASSAHSAAASATSRSSEINLLETLSSNWLKLPFWSWEYKPFKMLKSDWLQLLQQFFLLHTVHLTYHKIVLSEYVYLLSFMSRQQVWNLSYRGKCFLFGFYFKFFFPPNVLL